MYTRQLLQGVDRSRTSFIHLTTVDILDESVGGHGVVLCLVEYCIAVPMLHCCLQTTFYNVACRMSVLLPFTQ